MVASRVICRTTVLVLAVFSGLLGCPSRAQATALDDYVAESDPSYTYSIVNTITGLGYRAYIVDLTSQTWRSPGEVDRVVWKHWLTIVVPTFGTRTQGMLIIDGGDNGEPAPTVPEDLAVNAALFTQSVVAYLGQVPNQPLTFAGETLPRSEDAIIAYSFDRYLATGDDRWPVLLPMVKSAVRAMDAVQAIVASVTGGARQVDSFVVGGGSKRGWTTWLTGAVDPRVTAIAPLVIDVLNLDVQMDHHYAAYGFFSSAIQDYADLGVFDAMYTPEGQDLLTIVDPYEYRDRFAALPVYAINSTGDQFFLPDSARFYFRDLPGEKYLCYMPNTDHGLDPEQTGYNLLALYTALLNGTPRPQFDWTVEADESIIVQCVSTPSEVRLWRATAPAGRDFRLETLGPAWTDTLLTDQGGGIYVAQVPEPPAGWTAFFVELTFPSGGLFPYQFTTEVRVLPTWLPYAPDIDRNGLVNQQDMALFEACGTGPNLGPLAGRCIVADLDVDEDVDQTDFGGMQRCLTAPFEQIEPGCAR